MFNKKKKRIKQLELEIEALNNILAFYISLTQLKDMVTQINNEVNKQINQNIIPINMN